MTKEETALWVKRWKELASACYHREITEHTSFLGMTEQSVFAGELPSGAVMGREGIYQGVSYYLWGGFEEAERNILVFLPSYMSSEDFREIEKGEEPLLACIKITPLQKKFSDELTHRDYLGALMNLGVERDQIGDILTDGTEAYVMVMGQLASYIEGSLERIKHTSVSCRRVDPGECSLTVKKEEVSGSVASERLDAVTAMVYHLSRGTVQELIAADKVYVSGRIRSDSGVILKKGDVVSVRGYGRYQYLGQEGVSRKGRLYVTVQRYV